jgi:hypothetical protein
MQSIRPTNIAIVPSKTQRQRRGAVLLGLHAVAQALRCHAPKRNEESERLRYEHNRQLELGGEHHPSDNVGEHVVARSIAYALGAARARFAKVLLLIRDSVHGGVTAQALCQINKGECAYAMSLRE